MASRVADILMEMGRTQWMGAAPEELWGQEIERLGQIPNQIQANRFAQREQQLRQAELGGRLQLQQLQIGAAQREAANQTALDQVLGSGIIKPDGTMDLDKAQKSMQQSGHAHLFPQLVDQANRWEESRARLNKAKTDAAEAQVKLRDTLSDHLGMDAAQLDPTDLGTFHAFVASKAVDGSLDKATANRLLQTIETPDQAKAQIAQWTQASPTLQARQRTGYKEIPKEGVIADLSQIDPVTGKAKIIATGAPAEKKYQQKSVMLDGKPAEVHFDPQTGKSYDATGTDVSARVTPLTQTTADEAEIATAAKSIVNNPQDLTSLRNLSSLRGDQRLRLFNKIKELDPSFNVGMIDRRIKFLDEYEDPKGRAATNRGAMNNILQHAADLSAVNQQYRRSDVRIANTVINKLKEQSSTAWVAYQTPLAAIKDEIGLYFAGGYAPSVDQGKQWDKILSDNATPNQVEEFAKDIAHVALRRADTHNEQFRTMMGHDDPNLITPRARDAAERLGSGLGEEVKRFGSGGQIGQTPRPSAPPSTQARAPDLTGLAPGHGRTFTSGPFKGQTWTIGTDGQPTQVKSGG